jgi:hypothetical protein
MNKKQFNERTINKIYNFIKKEFNEEWAESFDNDPDKASWLLINRDVLETSKDWNNNFKIEDLLKSNKSAMESIYSTYTNIDDITPERMAQLSNAYDITKDDLKKYYDMRKKQTEAVNKYNQDRWAEIDKNRQEAERAKESSYFNSPIANEYARKHYIQGNPGKAYVNEVAGKVAGISDFLPWPFSYGGPAIRSAQKWYADEDVLTRGTAADFIGASLGGLSKIPGVNEIVKGTTGKIANILTRSKNPTAKQIANVVNKKAIAEEEAIAKREIANLNQIGNLDNLTQDELYKLYNSTDDPVIKASIEKVHKARQELEFARERQGHPEVAGNDAAATLAADEVANKAKALEQANNDAIRNAADYQSFLQAKSGEIEFSPYGDIPTFFKDVPAEVVAEQYARKQKPSFLSKALGEGILGIGRKTAGQSVARRNWDEINYKPDYNEDKAINEVIKMYSDNWSLNKLPDNYDNPLIQKAYERWSNNSKYDWDILNKLER